MERDFIQQLRQIVEKHTLRYVVAPHYEMNEGKRVMVGFDLELHGTHDHGTTRLSPGCHLCMETYQDLHRVAECVLPKEQRPSEYEIPPFDASLYASSNGTFEVVLPIRIQHRHHFFEPVDGCEERCLKEMQGELAELGVSKGAGAMVHR